MSKKAILEHFSKPAYRPSKFKEILKQLRVPQNRKREYRDLIRQLVDEGLITQLTGRKYVLSKEEDLLEGTLSIKGSGLGIVKTEGCYPLSIIIPERLMKKGYVPGDRVLVQVDKKGYGDQLNGRIVKVLGHSALPISGIFRMHSSKRFAVVSYIDTDAELTITIPNPPRDQDLDDHLVAVRLFNQATSEGNPQGEIAEDLGSIHDPKTDIQWILHRFEIPKSFPENVIQEVDPVEARISKAEIEARTDLRDKLTVTIDGEDARDFDDAVGIENTPHGYIIFVSIADVSHFVKSGTALHTEARNRANSTYFPDFHVPMLPSKLSSEVCTLKEGEDRLTLTAEIEVDKKGIPTRSDIYPSIIRSSKRLTYTQVYQWISSAKIPRIKNGKEIFAALETMHTVSQMLREARMSRGALNLDIPEAGFEINRSGTVVNVYSRESNFAHQLIEEFMLLANETVAQTLGKHGAALLYRIHEEPDETKIYTFNKLLSAFGLPQLEDIQNPQAINRLVSQVSRHPCGRQLNFQLLRCMKQAKYSPHNIGHFGLASDSYCHFTSPIRRFSDLVVHEVLRSVCFNKEKSNISPQSLEPVGDHLSSRERETMEAEREYSKLKKCRFMERYLSRRMRGTIVSITGFGIFVELDDYPVEGLIRLGDLRDDYYRYFEESQQLIGQRRHRKYRLGQKLTVFVSEVDIFRRRIRFIPSGEGYR